MTTAAYARIFSENSGILILAKTEESFKLIRRAVAEVVAEIKAENKDFEIPIFEFTDRQGKWDADGNVQAMNQEISEIAKSAETRNTRRIVIANEMGATGVDYQGDFTNIIFDPHLTSNADLAQAIKRTGRPNPKSSSDNTGKTK